MGAILTWARVDVRRHWRSLLLLAAMVALSTGVVGAAITAAHRGDTALARLDARSLPATVVVPTYDARLDVRPIRQLPYVIGFTRFMQGGIGLVDDGQSGATGQKSPVDPDAFTDTERLVVVQGRMFDPAAPDEAVVTPGWSAQRHLGVGDTVDIFLSTPHQELYGDGNIPRGPIVHLRIVGVVKAPEYLEWPGGYSTLIPSPGLATRYPFAWQTSKRPGCACPWASVAAMVRLRDGTDDIGRLTDDLARLYPGVDFALLNLEQSQSAHQHDIAVQSVGVLAFGLAALLAAVVMVGQAIVRQVSARRDDLTTARSLGLAAGQAVAVCTTTLTAAAALGAALGVAGAAATSRWTPLGLARVAEPTPGIMIDSWPLLGIFVVVVVATATTAGVMTLRQHAGAGAVRRPAHPRRSRLHHVLRAAPVPVLIGGRYALESRGGRRSVPAMPALVAAVVAVTGVVSSVVIGNGVDDALTHQERYGQNYSASSFVGFGSRSFLDGAKAQRALEGLGYVTGVALPRQSTATTTDHTVSVALMSYGVSTKPLHVTVLAGRMVQSADEIALGPSALRALGAQVGDEVDFLGSAGSHAFRIVGEALVPNTAPARYDQGGWVTDAGYDDLFKGFDAHWALVSTDPSAGSGDDLWWRLGIDFDDAMHGAAGASGVNFGELIPPRAITTPLRQMRWFPLALACFLVLLALGAAAHALTVTARVRGREIAVLRAVGMTRAGAGLILLTQVLVVCVVGLLAGVPLGIAVGRTAWRALASVMPLQYVAPGFAGVEVLVAAPLLALAIAVVPAALLARRPLAPTLRAE
ncbi:FtsX-like permease family protein [Nocardioides ultimimeridianus]